jgi:hypothetical protein
VTQDKAKLQRIRLIERIRSVEQRQAASDAFQAEAVRQRLERLSEKTRSLAQLYALRDHARDGADLVSAAAMGTQLRTLGRTADAQARAAKVDADARLVQLASAERRHKRAQEQRVDAHRAMVDQLGRPDFSASRAPARKTGTDIE